VILTRELVHDVFWLFQPTLALAALSLPAVPASDVFPSQNKQLLLLSILLFGDLNLSNGF